MTEQDHDAAPRGTDARPPGLRAELAEVSVFVFQILPALVLSFFAGDEGGGVSYALGVGMRESLRKGLRRLRAACLANLGLKIIALAIAVFLHVLVRARAEEERPAAPACTCVCHRGAVSP